MSDLLEHVTSPVEILRLASALLRPGGCILITTPNTHSLSHRLMGNRWTHYKVEHLFYPNPPAMRLMAEKAGLRVELCKTADKAVNLDYLHSQLGVYRHWALTPLMRLAFTLFRPLATRGF